MDNKKANIEYFNKIANRWDNMIFHSPSKILYFFELLNLGKEDKVLDVGTGTGILIPYIMKEIGNNGKLDAIDISSKMIEIASKRYDYPNISFIEGDAEIFDFGKRKYDDIICYSVFPHFECSDKTLRHFFDILEDGGKIGIFHSSSKESINNIHRNNGFHFEKNMLPPARDLKITVEKAGFSVEHLIDNSEMYLIIGVK